MQDTLSLPGQYQDADEDMKLRDDDKDWLQNEIASQIEASVDEFRPHGWRRIAHWSREWGISGALITAFIALLAVTLGALYQSFAHVKEETEFRTQTIDHFKELDRDLLAIQTLLSSAQPTK
jgi:hypothetical protein